ncbi:sensor histidine kinase [Sorangium sp. So ce693]
MRIGPATARAGKISPRRPGKPLPAAARSCRRRPRAPVGARSRRARGGQLGCDAHGAGPHQPPVQRAQVRRGGPIHVVVRGLEGRALLIVRDHGMGIAEADQARIFERFERAVSVRNFGGLGLGLYIVRWIVTSHGGTIRVESKPGAGAAFIIELPFHPVEAGSETAADGHGAPPPRA